MNPILFAHHWKWFLRPAPLNTVGDTQELYAEQCDMLREKFCSEFQTLEQRVTGALAVIRQHGGTDGAHHKQWVIDQVLRSLTGPQYEKWVQAYQGDDEDYWDGGIAP